MTGRRTNPAPDPQLAAELKQLLGEGPQRAIRMQTDAERAVLSERTKGDPILDISTFSNTSSTPFIDYINADILHTLAQPRSSHPEEMTFISMAHVMELMFKLLNYELMRAKAAIRRGGLDEAAVIFRRVHKVLEYATQAWGVLSTLTPEGYLAFRDYLGDWLGIRVLHVSPSRIHTRQQAAADARASCAGAANSPGAGRRARRAESLRRRHRLARFARFSDRAAGARTRLVTALREQRVGAGGVASSGFPLEVFDAVRAHWPFGKPMSVRISASDWAPGGIVPEDGVKVAAMFRDHGVDIVDVSAGQTSRWASPVYGRMFQTSFSEMVRNEARIPTIAVGAITTADQVNTIIAAGRADLCALARPHLTNPNFSLAASAEYGHDEQFWPLPHLPGKDQAFRLSRRQQTEQRSLQMAARPSSHHQRRQPGAFQDVRRARDP